MEEQTKLKEQSSVPRVLRNLIRFPLGIYVAVVLCGVLIAGSWFSYAGQLEFAQWNPVLFLGAAVLGIVLCWIINKFKEAAIFIKLGEKHNFIWVTILLSILLFLVEVVIVDGCSFITKWDVKELTHFAEFNSNYFSAYPNQLFLAGVFQGINQAAGMLGMQDGYLCCAIVGCVHVSASIFLVAQIARRLGGIRVGCCCFVLTFVFLGLSPWILVPYSDTYAVFWTTFILFSYVCIRNKPAKVFALVFGSLIGYSIKPTAIFVLVAIVFVELICQISAQRKRHNDKEHSVGISYSSAERRKTILFSLLSGALSLGLGLCLVSGVKDIGITIKDSRALSFTHYLMMGFNEETGGMYSEADVLYSLDQPAQERQKANIETWKNRISEMGKRGILHLLASKSLSNYADGTFSWEGEGNFYVSVSGENETLKAFYGIGNKQENRFAPLAQIIWFMVLLGLVLFCFFKKTPSKYECVAMLSIFMLSCFLLIFECRARYLFLFVPFYTLLCVLGWKECVRRFTTKVPHIMHKLQNE